MTRREASSRQFIRLSPPSIRGPFHGMPTGMPHGIRAEELVPHPLSRPRLCGGVCGLARWLYSVCPVAAHIASLPAQPLGRADHAFRLASANVRRRLDLLPGRLGIGRPACGALHARPSGPAVPDPQPPDAPLRRAERPGRRPGATAPLQLPDGTPHGPSVSFGPIFSYSPCGLPQSCRVLLASSTRHGFRTARLRSQGSRPYLSDRLGPCHRAFC